MDPGVRTLVLSRLEADASASGTWSGLVLAALDGQGAHEAELLGNAKAPRADASRTSPALAGAFIRTVAIEGFRGIGPVQTLELRPGPGLTLVVWREGWRNLHHPAASLSGTFLVEGERGPCAVSRRWEPEAAFEAGVAAAQ